MTATDELRRLLDERGVEWMDDSYAQLWCTVWNGHDGKQWRMTENRSGMLTELKAWHVTPEQAIAATLGRVECENIAPDYLDFLCSVCGFVHYHSDENDTGDGNDWAYCPRCGKAVKR
jgi:hypothetical protein